MLSTAYRSTPKSTDFSIVRQLGSSVARRSARAVTFCNGGVEPSLDEVMADPIVHSLMDRDGVAIESLNSLIAEVRGRLL
jgi:hypothetical protein